MVLNRLFKTTQKRQIFAIYIINSCYIYTKYTQLSCFYFLHSYFWLSLLPMKPTSDDPLQLAREFVQQTGVHIFLTGKAGTGKTTFLHSLKDSLPKRMIVTAPTGVAAINAGGVTIHSFFQLPFGPQVLENRVSETQAAPENKAINKFSREKVNIIRSLELLVIDEISMVRADLLDAVDKVLRRFRNRNLPFGGIQLLMIGDLCQLAPVVKDTDWDILKAHYPSPFFFDSNALKKSGFITIELQHVYRQSDQRFIKLLNKVRDNRLDKEAMDVLNSRCLPEEAVTSREGYITLTTHNSQAAQLNNKQMATIDHPGVVFEAEISGEFPSYVYPNEPVLLLKPGAQVMFVKNDASKEKRYYNGKIGTVVEIEEGLVSVLCPGDDAPILTGPIEWHNYAYTLDDKTDEIVEQLLGTFIQIPLKPAWAITIHKSQGLTFDKAIIDAGAAFAHGQVYVALSRCRTLEGMILKSRIGQSCIRSDAQVQTFLNDVAYKKPDSLMLDQMKRVFEFQLLADLNDYTGLKRFLDGVEKVLAEHEKVLVGYRPSVFGQVKEQFRKDILAVSIAFQPQLKRLFDAAPSLEENHDLQDRLIKGCRYFFRSLNELNDLFVSSVSFETDNRAIKKQVNDAVERVEREIARKLACIEAAKEGFSVSNYLSVRSRTAIEKQSSSKTVDPSLSREVTPAEMDAAASSIYTTLKIWRDNTAKRLMVKHFQIISTRTLTDIAVLRPTNLTQLKGIKGIGDKKVAQFGRELVSIVLNHTS